MTYIAMLLLKPCDGSVSVGPFGKKPQNVHDKYSLNAVESDRQSSPEISIPLELP